MSRRRKKTAETMRSHLILFGSVAILTLLVVLLGRTPAARLPSNRLPASSLELRRGFSLSIGERSQTSNPAVTVTPIPLPPGELERAREQNDFVPLTRSAVEVPEATPRDSDVVPRADVGKRPVLVDTPAAELRWHRVVEGESLETIAMRYFGREQMAAEIFALNRDILSQPDLLPLGVYLRLPAGGD